MQGLAMTQEQTVRIQEFCYFTGMLACRPTTAPQPEYTLLNRSTLLKTKGWAANQSTLMARAAAANRGATAAPGARQLCFM
jgi:hypothetical protein